MHVGFEKSWAWTYEIGIPLFCWYIGRDMTFKYVFIKIILAESSEFYPIITVYR